jgi:hypothetical protein
MYILRMIIIIYVQPGNFILWYTNLNIVMYCSRYSYHPTLKAQLSCKDVLDKLLEDNMLKNFDQSLGVLNSCMKL